MPSSPYLRILHVEDSDADALLFAEEIRQGGGGIMRIDRMSTLAMAQTALDLYNYGIIVTDLTLPDSRGLDTVKTLIPKASYCPLVVLTKTSDLVSATQAVRLGAQDVLFKGEQSSRELVRSLVLAVERFQVAGRNTPLAIVQRNQAPTDVS